MKNKDTEKLVNKISGHLSEIRNLRADKEKLTETVITLERELAVQKEVNKEIEKRKELLAKEVKFLTEKYKTNARTEE
jgi:hypothetical protein